MELHRVEAVGIQRARNGLTDLLRRVEEGVHYLLLRFDHPVAALISHRDYVHYTNLARKNALTRAFLQGRGYDPDDLTDEEFIRLLATQLKMERR